MKKLMITFGVIAMAMVSSAATMKWKISEVPQVGDATVYTMLCFIEADTTGAANSMLLDRTTAESYAKAGDFASLTGSKKAKDAVFDASKGKVSGQSNAFSTYKNQWINEYGGTDSGTFYAILFNAEDLADATKFMITTSESVIYGSGSSTAQVASLGTGTWQDIGGADTPEPTSGLLLLLGVAGLALKRRRV